MKIIFIIIFLITPLIAQSYPVFFSCKSGQLIFKDSLDDGDLFKKFLQLGKDQQSKFADNLCRGASDCIKDLELAVKLSKSSYDVAKKIFEDELAKIKERVDAVEVTKLNLESLSQMRLGFTLIRACEQTKSLLTPSDFINNGFLITPYPFYSNYMYATGCKGVDAQSCLLPSKDTVDRIIEGAIVTGTDPHFALALTLMENGALNDYLYLDPVGIMDSIGCSGKQIANGTEEGKALDSYGTSYIIQPDIKKIPAVKNKLESYFDHFKIEREKGSSFYCYDVNGKSDPALLDKAKGNSCCLDLGFKAKNKDIGDVNKVLTYHFVNNIANRPYGKMSDPAWRAQRFNGYTDLMGAAEGVSPWRAGVNYYEDPAYGYQTMDFILNALMFNPYISQKIDEFSARSKVKWESLLCKGKSDGTYHIDSDNYFEKHKHSKRLAKVQLKFKRGAPFSSLSTREKRVVLADMEETATQNSLMPQRLPQSRHIALGYEIANALGGAELVEFSIASEERWRTKIAGRVNLSKSDLALIYRIKKRELELSEGNIKASQKMNELLNTINLECCKEQCGNCSWLSEFTNQIYSNESKNLELPVNDIANKFKDELTVIFLEAKELKSAQEENWKKFGTLKHLMSKERELMLAMAAVTEREPLDEALKRHASNPAFKDVEEKFKIFYESTIAEEKPYNVEAAYKEYFKSIYPKRSTLQGSSVYPWRRFNEEEVEKLVKKMKSQ